MPHRLFDYPDRAWFAALALAMFGLVAFSLALQASLRLAPCPFCIFQRICFAALGLVFLLGALHAPRAPGARKVWGVLAFVAAAAGMGYAGRHSWVQLNPPELPSCGPGLNFIVEQHSWLGAARKVLLATGDCSNIDWQFLGLSMPMWCLLWFVALGVGALYAAFKHREKHRFHR